MHWHMANENRNKFDQVAGSAFWAGRAWWYLNTKGGFGQRTIAAEWYFGKHAHHTMIHMTTNFVMEREITFAIGLWRVFCFYITFSFPFLPSWSVEHGDRASGIRIFDNAIWVEIWARHNEGRSDDPFWMKDHRFSPVDSLLGRGHYSYKVISEHDADIEMPEGKYPAKVTLKEQTYSRKRWPIKTRKVTSYVEFPQPIPIPGKGENSWDMDDDGYSAMGCLADTVEGAIDEVKSRIFERRERYGGKDWLPA